MKIKIAFSDGSRREIDAVVFGDWAAHESPEVTREWMVTYVPLGTGFPVSGLDRDDSIALANRLAIFLFDMPRATTVRGLRRITNRNDWMWQVRSAVGEVLGGVPWYP